MQLHTAQASPDWQGVAASKRNIWQRLAAHTKGVVTPANFVSLAGLALVISGIYMLSFRRYSVGVLFIAAGRGLDVVDGWLANATGTKSPLGEAVDATIDKIATLGTLLILPFLGLVPVLAVVLLAAAQVTASVVALDRRRHGLAVHPSRIGKLGMGASWLSLLLFIAANIWTTDTLLTVAAYVVLALGVAMAFAAINGYRQAAK